MCFHSSCENLRFRFDVDAVDVVVGVEVDTGERLKENVSFHKLNYLSFSELTDGTIVIILLCCSEMTCNLYSYCLELNQIFFKILCFIAYAH